MKNEKALISSLFPAPPSVEIPPDERQETLGGGYYTVTAYKGYTARIVGDVLEVAVFARGGEAEYRIFLSEDDYVSEVKKDGVWKRSQCKPYSKYNPWYCPRTQFVTDEESRAAAVDRLGTFERALGKFSEDAENIFRRICDHAERIGKNRLKRRHERIRESIDEKMLLVREEIPKSFYKWMDETVYKNNRYILYQYSRKKVMRGFCSYCKTFVGVTGAKHLACGKCPNCKSAVTYLARGKTSRFSVEKDLIYMQRVKDGDVVFRYFYNNRRFDILADRIQVTDDFTETYREFFRSRDKYSYDAFAWKWKRSGADLTRGYIFPENLKRIFGARTDEFPHLKYIPYTALCKNIEPVRARDFYETCLNSPQLEYLAKAGLYQICVELITDRYNELSEAGNIFRKYKLKAADIEFLRRHNSGFSEMRVYLRCRNIGRLDIAERMIEVLQKWRSGAVDYIFDIMEYLPFEAAMKYISEQTELNRERYGNSYYWHKPTEEQLKSDALSEWHDYLDNCRALEWDLSDTKVIKPKNLKERHDFSVEVVKLKKNQIRSRDISERYYGNMFTYAYRDRDYSVIIPRDLADLKYEGDKMHHCVYTNYSERVADGRSVILFIRDNRRFYEPLATAEIDPETNEVVQIRAERNNPPTEEVAAFFEKYKRQVLEKLKKNERKAA